MNLEDKINEIKANYDDPEILSTSVIELASYMIPLSYEIANAELEETKERQSIRDIALQMHDKVTIAEAEDRAVIDTHNKYGQLKIEFDALKELINAVKSRLTVLGWEKKQ